VQIRKHALPALYRVEIAGGNGRPARTVDLRGELVPPGWQEPDAVADGARFESAGWRCWVPELRLHFAREPRGDRALPALASLLDPETARGVLEQAIRAGSPHHAGFRIESLSPRIARYNRGSRCTIVYELRFPSGSSSHGWPESAVAKVHRGEKGRNAFESMRALWNSRLRDSRSVVLAEPLAFLTDLNVLVQGGITHERTLEELLRSSLTSRSPKALDDFFSCIAKTATGLAELHGCEARPRQIVTLEGELTRMRALLARLGTMVGEVRGAATPLLARIEAFDREHPAESLRPAHGSFRPAQVLLQGNKVGFIDFDGFCRAEPAVDIARFRAVVKDVGLRALGAEDGTDAQSRAKDLAQLDQLCERFSVRYEAAAPISRERVALWEALDLLTLVLHGWTKAQFDRLVPRLALLRHHLRANGLDR
jgi:hypothetical protein